MQEGCLTSPVVALQRPTTWSHEWARWSTNVLPRKQAAPKTADDVRVAVSDFSAKVHQAWPLNVLWICFLEIYLAGGFTFFPLLLENGWLTNLLRRGWKHQPDIATWWSWPVMGTQPQFANWASWSVIRTHRRMHANICRSRSSVAWMPLDIPWPQRLSAKCRMWCEQTWDSTCRSYSLFRHNQFYALKSPKQKHKIQLLKVGMTSGACSSSLTSFNKEFVIVFPKEARIYLWLLVCM